MHASCRAERCCIHAHTQKILEIYSISAAPSTSSIPLCISAETASLWYPFTAAPANHLLLECVCVYVAGCSGLQVSRNDALRLTIRLSQQFPLSNHTAVQQLCRPMKTLFPVNTKVLDYLEGWPQRSISCSCNNSCKIVIKSTQYVWAHPADPQFHQQIV